MRKFSAFRLFYDEFIYKHNIMVEYESISKNINNIRKALYDLRDTYKGDKDYYINRLNKANRIVKKELDNILAIQPYIYELYYVLYNRNVEANTNKVNDMPFVISCSFYDEYKNIENLNYISRYTSLEKKDIRNEAKKLGYVNYFNKLLKDRNKEYLDSLVSLLDEVSNIKIDVLVSLEENKKKYEKIIEKLRNQLIRCESKARLCEDFDIIKDIMEIAFKGDFDTFNIIIDKIYESIDNEYVELANSKDSFLENICFNYISYDSYLKFVNNEEKNKIKYDSEFLNNNNVIINDNLFINDFRKVIIGNYYDERFNNGKDNKKLINDIADYIFNYRIFLASYSKRLNRNNSVKYALLNKVYELYNPYDLLERYNIIKSKKIILGNVKNKCIQFFEKNYINNMFSDTEEYDSRSYDLIEILSDLDIDELVGLYNRLSEKLDLDILDKLALFISNCISIKCGNNNSSKDNLYEFAREYLNYDKKIVKKEYKNKFNNYQFLYGKYLCNSAFEKLKRGM